MKVLAWTIALGLVATILAARDPESVSHKVSIQPVAMAISSGGQLFVLDKSLGMIRVSSINDMTKYDLIFQFAQEWQPIDATCMSVGSDVQLFVTLSQGLYGQIVAYTGTGQWEQSLPQKELLSGIVADPPKSRIFVVAPRTNRIYLYDWNGTSATAAQEFVRIPSAEALGPGAIDPDKQILYVADLRLGEIFSIDIESKKSQVVASSVGQPNALAFDTLTKNLYIADSSGPKVFEINMSSQNQKVRVLSSDRALRQPQAIAVDPTGGVFVGDQAAKAVFRIDRTGKVVGTYQYPIVVSNPK